MAYFDSILELSAHDQLVGPDALGLRQHTVGSMWQRRPGHFMARYEREKEEGAGVLLSPLKDKSSVIQDPPLGPICKRFRYIPIAGS
jgi:hypothetical protein